MKLLPDRAGVRRIGDRGLDHWLIAMITDLILLEWLQKTGV